MTNIDRNYVIYALAWLAIGTIFGFWMGASGNLQYVTVHVTMLLPGFVTLVIYGMIYRLWPELKQSRLAPAQYWLAVLSLPFAVVGSWLYVENGSIPLLAAATAVATIAAILMLVAMGKDSRPA